MPCIKAFQAKTLGCEGHFQNSLKNRIYVPLHIRVDIEGLCSVRRIQTTSPTPSDSQYDASELTVRPDGLKN